MMAWAAASLPSGERVMEPYSSGIPCSMTSTFSVWPMMPVDAATIFSAGQPTALAAAAQTRSAFSSPLGAQALAFPLLITAARALPSARWRLSTWMWAAFTAFFV